jgi:hypothetical protein
MEASKVKVTKFGVIMALKSLGTFVIATFPSFHAASVSWGEFVYQVGIFALISVPTDLYLLNHVSEYYRAQGRKECAKGGHK